tara:strand:+ start:27 stop:509 length:483 start_codon:yes stop_codon:yes gene_type:complete
MSFTLIFLVLILGIFVFFLTASTSTVKTIHHTSLQMPQILIDKDVPKPHCHPWGCGKISNTVPKEVTETLSKLKTKPFYTKHKDRNIVTKASADSHHNKSHPVPHENNKVITTFFFHPAPPSHDHHHRHHHARRPTHFMKKLHESKHAEHKEHKKQYIHH